MLEIIYLYVSCAKMFNTLLSAKSSFPQLPLPPFTSLFFPPNWSLFVTTVILPILLVNAHFSLPMFISTLTLYIAAWQVLSSLPPHTSYSNRYRYKKTVQSNHRYKSQPPLFKQATVYPTFLCYEYIRQYNHSTSIPLSPPTLQKTNKQKN